MRFSPLPGLALALFLGYAPHLAAEDAAPASLTLDIGTNVASPALTAALAAYTQKNGVNVVVHDSAYHLHDHASEAFGANADIVCSSDDVLHDLASNQKLVPLTPPASVRNLYLTDGWAAFTFSGKVWAYPMTADAITLIYNKKFITNPPATFEEMGDVEAETEREHQVHAIAWDYNSAYFSWPLLAAGGAAIFETDSAGHYDPAKNGVASDSAITGASLLRNMITAGLMPPYLSYADAEAAMNKGQLAMTLNGSWAWRNLKNSRIEIGIAPIPSVGGKPSPSFVIMTGCGVQKTPNVAHAIDLMENGLMSDETMASLIKSDVFTGISLNKKMLKASYGSDNMRRLFAIIRSGNPIPISHDMQVFWKQTHAALVKITSGQASAADALKEASDKIAKRSLL